MYNSPLYGKEWNWRNIKMETRELPIDSQSERLGKGIFCNLCRKSLFCF